MKTLDHPVKLCKNESQMRIRSKFGHGEEYLIGDNLEFYDFSEEPRQTNLRKTAN